jgi:hypothetical protein
VTWPRDEWGGAPDDDAAPDYAAEPAWIDAAEPAWIDAAEPAWIDAALAAMIASWCRGCFGARVSVPVSHHAARQRRSSFPLRSLGMDTRLADTLCAPRELWAAGERDLYRLAAAHITAMREHMPVGPDSFAVGVACAVVFLALNDRPCDPGPRFGRLSAGRDTFDARALAQWLQG